ncbi:MAG: phytoene/squalene synthase family protein [Gemmatimonadales bacterium]
MLDRVSRTCAHSIRYLAKPIAPIVTRAYLLCRVADTIEDSPSERLTLPRKQELFHRLAAALSDSTTLEGWRDVFENPLSADEELVNQVPDLVAEFREIDPEFQACIVPWVVEMCEGMAEHVNNWSLGGASASGPETLEDLERYCYYVAGTVGLMLTEIFAANGDFKQRADANRHEIAKRFGLGLQLTNVARDAWFDLQEGRWFIPRAVCERHQVTRENFFQTDNFARAKSALLELVERAEGHLTAAHAYVRSLKRRRYHTRLFCLAPMNLAAATLRNLRRDQDYPRAGHRSKITRSELGRVVRASRMFAFTNGLSYRHTLSLMRVD